jgi:winged helix DNA-binding protein
VVGPSWSGRVGHPRLVIATAARRRIDDRERRARLAMRHHLAPAFRGRSPVEVARDMVGLHATDPASVHLAARARMADGFVIADLERELYERRSLLRMLGMRRTMFTEPLELVPIVNAAATRAIAVAERKRDVAMFEAAGVANPAGPWLQKVEDATVEALRARGEAVATELSKDVPELRIQIPFGEGKKWQGTLGVSTRILFLLSMEGRIVRARPRGTWLSSQYRWAPVERWLGGPIADVPIEQAQVELVQRWLRAFGPGTANDIRWWTGWPLGNVRKTLAALSTAEVDLDGGETGIVLADDLEPVAPVEPFATFLPALDPSVMGWKSRAFYLGPHGPALFDTIGNAGPMIWWDGHAVGAWGQRASGEVVYRLLEDIGRAGERAVATEAARLTDWMSGLKVTPRFPTALFRELGA